jgi:hypothetical protein
VVGFDGAAGGTGLGLGVWSIIVSIRRERVRLSGIPTSSFSERIRAIASDVHLRMRPTN